MKVLFVCMGNICRSPTAHGVFARYLRERAPELDVEVDSAGTHDYHVGSPPDPRAIEAAARRGVDLTAQRLFDQSGAEVGLTAGEMDLLKVFLDHPDRVLLRNQLVSMTHTNDAEVFDRAIDVLVGRLRRKLEADPHRPQLIRTVRSEGYRFTGRVEWTDASD